MIPSLADEPASRDQVAAVVDIVRDVLGEALCAACVYGSAVAGGLRPSSDLDILVVSNRSLDREMRAAIVRRLLPVSGRNAMRGATRRSSSRF